MRYISIVLLTAFATSSSAQHSDTISYHSRAFDTTRTVVVTVPDFYRYTSADVHLPVIILLDGQHEWFIEPLLNDIRYLQYTHEVPQAIVVTVPLLDRVAESAPDSLQQDTLPLLHMLTKELPKLLEPYHPGEITVLVGHSFTASFSLYAFLKAPDPFDAVIALSPGHMVKFSVPAVADLLVQQKNKRVLIAVGGPERSKDGGHYTALVGAVKAARPARTDGRLLFKEYSSAGHTGLPTIAFADLLATLFKPFALRDQLAPVNDEYKLVSEPPAANVLVEQALASCVFLGSELPWEVAEINGLASRVWNSGYDDRAIAIYQKAVELYPKYYEFHASLGELLMKTDQNAAMVEFATALRLLESEEKGMPDRDDVRADIENLMR